ncbi:MAG: hypothetical protein IJT59_01260 [Desulfovibrionaceae bacterium]|nr:hypothetical protein [Desulfovibrionaceae bacterium]
MAVSWLKKRKKDKKNFNPQDAQKRIQKITGTYPHETYLKEIKDSPQRQLQVILRSRALKIEVSDLCN